MKIPDIIQEAARRLRNNMTESEVILWSYIQWWKLWVTFLRQKPVYVFTEYSWLDRYVISDFYCFEKKIIIEVDGSIHSLEEVYLLDQYKEWLLKNLWFTIIRLTNEEIKQDPKKVIIKIKDHL